MKLGVLYTETHEHGKFGLLQCLTRILADKIRQLKALFPEPGLRPPDEGAKHWPPVSVSAGRHYHYDWLGRLYQL